MFLRLDIWHTKYHIGSENIVKFQKLAVLLLPYCSYISSYVEFFDLLSRNFIFFLPALHFLNLVLPKPANLIALHLWTGLRGAFCNLLLDFFGTLSQ